MSSWARRRFWSEVHIAPGAEGYQVLLDGRPVNTPARVPLALPTRALAERVAAEWRAQEERIDPETMPATRAANAAIDKVRPQPAPVAAMIASYAEADLICYRAQAPDALVAREAAAWDPLLDWAAERFGARLTVARGVMHVAQPEAALRALARPVKRMTAFELAAVHDLVTMSGSLVIALAAAEHRAPPEQLWRCSRIDEDWQAELWGEDAEAAALARGRERCFLDAAAFLDDLSDHR